MTSPELERLVGIGKLKREPGAQAEIDGLVRSASLVQSRKARQSAAKDQLSTDTVRIARVITISASTPAATQPF